MGGERRAYSRKATGKIVREIDRGLTERPNGPRARVGGGEGMRCTWDLPNDEAGELERRGLVESLESSLRTAGCKSIPL